MHVFLKRGQWVLFQLGFPRFNMRVWLKCCHTVLVLHGLTHCLMSPFLFLSLYGYASTTCVLPLSGCWHTFECVYLHCRALMRSYYVAVTFPTSNLLHLVRVHNATAHRDSLYHSLSPHFPAFLLLVWLVLACAKNTFQSLFDLKVSLSIYSPACVSGAFILFYCNRVTGGQIEQINMCFIL